MSAKRWTTKEINYIKENHKTKTVKEMAKELNRSYGSVYMASRRLKLKPKKDRAEYALYEKEEMIAFGTIKEIARQLKVKESTVKFYGTPSYIKRTSENARRLVKIS